MHRCFIHKLTSLDVLRSLKNRSRFSVTTASRNGSSNVVLCSVHTIRALDCKGASCYVCAPFLHWQLLYWSYIRSTHVAHVVCLKQLAQGDGKFTDSLNSKSAWLKLGTTCVERPNNVTLGRVVAVDALSSTRSIAAHTTSAAAF